MLLNQKNHIDLFEHGDCTDYDNYNSDGFLCTVGAQEREHIHGLFSNKNNFWSVGLCAFHEFQIKLLN